MSTIVTAETLDDAIGWSSPFDLSHRDDTGRVTLSRADDIYAPEMVELDPEFGLLVDSYAIDQSPWQAVAGYSGQHGYSGPVMHASEYIGGGMAHALLETAGDCPTYVVTEVAVTECDDACWEDCGGWSAGHHEPAGWILLQLRP